MRCSSGWGRVARTRRFELPPREGVSGAGRRRAAAADTVSHFDGAARKPARRPPATSPTPPAQGFVGLLPREKGEEADELAVTHQTVNCELLVEFDLTGASTHPDPPKPQPNHASRSPRTRNAPRCPTSLDLKSVLAPLLRPSLPGLLYTPGALGRRAGPRDPGALPIRYRGGRSVRSTRAR